MKTLVIIDGKSVFYRGYYAMGNLALKDGTPTAGVYGFAVIAMELVKTLQPNKVVVAWDKAKTSIEKRRKIYPEYKAGRVKPSEDFYVQIPLLRGLIEALGWEFLECDGYEADDIIGTIAKQADEVLDEEGNCPYKTYIISSDLDMLQIVDENTRMCRLIKGFSQIEEMDVPAVEAKYGIRKEQFLDLKALKGDASDNIPGVAGIGEKTAAKLLGEFGDLEGIYRNIDKIKGSVQKKLLAGRESAEMSYELAKIMTDAPVNLDEIEDLVVDREKIIAKLRELEFFSLVNKFKQELGVNSETTPEKEDERVEPSKVELPKDLIVENDVKKMMHENPGLSAKILTGQEFWDLNQADFLLNPLRRKGLVDLNVDKSQMYWRQQFELNKIPKLKQILTEFDLPLIPILYKMEQKGILIDKNYFVSLKSELENQIRQIEQKIYTEVGREFNLNSPMQLSVALFEDLGLPTKNIKKTTKGFSTGAKELEKLMGEHEVVALIVEHRTASKLLSTYVVPLAEMADKEGRVHTTFTQDVTATGRLSSLNPNLQNIPVRRMEGRKIRQGFIAPEGRVLVSADYAQFELRLAAVLAGDDELIKSFNEDLDVHTKTAAEVFGVDMQEVSQEQRRAAKVINFGILYGMSVRGLSEATGMPYYEAKEFIDNYFAVRSPIKTYLEKTLQQAREKGYVETFYGRRRPTPDVKSSNFIVRTAAERAAQNMPIQGTEADLMKRAMIQVDRLLPKGANLILQVHDSLIVECEKNQMAEVQKILKETMEKIAPELKVKLAVEVTVGENWGML